MLLVLDLGFSSLVVLAVCAVFPLIGLFLRRKWCRFVARKDEIRRLMILASEETARAEIEASVGHEYSYSHSHSYAPADGYASVNGYRDKYETAPAAQRNLCAVCYALTTTRCSKCKAVRYCSGKCQIIHWRQGHKNECHPPAIKSNFGHVPSNYEKGVSFYTNVMDEKIIKSKSAASFHSGAKIVDSTQTLKVKSNLKVDCNAENSSESSDSGFTGFSATTMHNESSDDISICDSISSFDSGKLDEHLPDDAGDNKTISSAQDMDQVNRIFPTFEDLVDSSDNSGLRELNHHNPAFYAEHNLSKAACLVDKSIQNALVSDPPTGLATFLNAAPLAEQTAHPHYPSALVNPNRSRDSNSTKFSLNSSTISSGSNINGNTLLHSSVPGKKGDNQSVLVRANSCNPSSSQFLETDGSLMMRSVSARSSDLSTSVQDGSSVCFHATKPSSFHRDSTSNGSLCNSSVGGCRSNDKQENSIMTSRKVEGVNAAESVSAEVGFSPNNGSELKTFLGNSMDHLKGSTLPRHYSLRGSSDMAAQYNGQGLFPYELFVKLYSWKEVELIPCGLRNCGNSCFANAVLQCLAFTPPLTAYFLQGLHSQMCAKKDWCFMCEFERLILKAKEGESPVSPFEIVSRLENIGSQLSNGREEDAHEFLRYAIDAMESICLSESWTSFASSEEDITLIGLTFGGYLQSKIRCIKCQGKSERREKIMDLTVEIEGDIGTLEEALRKFTIYEILDGENKYQCNRCGSYEKAKKKLTILEAPNVLTIALKRFQSGKYGKLNKSIRYAEILDMAPYMTSTSDKSPVYRLYGVIVHLDVMNASYSGHYICYVKSPMNKWFKIDDSTVTPVDLETVLKVGAYILLYSRCSPRAPRSVRNQMLSCDPKPKLPSRVMSKMPTFNAKVPNSPSPDLVSMDGLASIESFYSKFHLLKRMLEEDSRSDSSSLFSNNSDEGSSSSDRTRDSTGTTEDFSEYPCGGCSSPWRNSSDSDSSSSSLPSSSSPSPMANTDRRASGFPEMRWPRAAESIANNSFWSFDMNKALGTRNGSVNNSKYSSNFRETNSERLADAAMDFDGVKWGRRSATVKRTGSIP
ncbi:hypothetical protein SAY87_014089 [Trapa incisa]|uniref:ubiquitinyl hydrolase 1 n=1 Tax=Trapa incisa TaxID=236973 RepID=A0AAN7JL69_9MYRT|nr:hypothetical protein SAY87_014089 [Trapa incisa]